MKNFSHIFISLAAILALSFSYVPFGVVAQETGNLQPPPSSSSLTPPPPPPPPPALVQPTISAPSTFGESVEPQRMPPPPEGQTGMPSHEPPRMSPPPQGKTDTFHEPPRMPPPPQQNSKSQHESPGMPPSPQKSNRVLKQESSKDFESTDFDETDSDQEEQEEEYVDPKEIKDTLRQLKDIKKQAQSTIKRAQKTSNFTNEIEELNTLLSEVARMSEAIQNASSGSEKREALQEFYDVQLWDTFNNIRIKIEFPQELKSIEKDLKRVEKLMSSKKFSIEKVDMNIVKTKIEEIRSAINEARDHFNNGNFDDAREALSVIHEGLHPGEIFGVLNQLREIDKRLKSLKGEIRSVFQEVLEPVFGAINEGDFREANMLLNDIQRELWRLFDKVKGRSSRLNEDVRQKLQNLEEQLENRHQQIEKQKSVSEERQSIKYESYRQYQASIAETLLNWFR